MGRHRIMGVALMTLTVGGCGRDLQLGYSRPRFDADATSSGGATQTDAEVACRVTTCSGKIYACGDCLDNDGDGLIDAADPECLGPCDNTEDSYYGGLPGQNNAPCKQDCYFDQDTGSGNDGCHFSQKCDSLSVAPNYPPSGDAQCAYDPATSIPGTAATCAELLAQQSAACLEACLPLTPNGCDCFGCCELPARSGRFVWIGSTSGGIGSCDSAHLDDETLCKPCTPVKSCFNECSPCEICAGQTTIDASCTSGSEAECPSGERGCGLPGQAGCANLEYCIGGCCVLAPG